MSSDKEKKAMAVVRQMLDPNIMDDDKMDLATRLLDMAGIGGRPQTAGAGRMRAAAGQAPVPGLGEPRFEPEAPDGGDGSFAAPDFSVPPEAPDAPDEEPAGEEFIRPEDGAAQDVPPAPAAAPAAAPASLLDDVMKMSGLWQETAMRAICGQMLTAEGAMELAKVIEGADGGIPRIAADDPQAMDAFKHMLARIASERGWDAACAVEMIMAKPDAEGRAAAAARLRSLAGGLQKRNG